jgi:O-acetyl-ADP-ribose deacetylase (regulator of RNase III)
MLVEAHGPFAPGEAAVTGPADLPGVRYVIHAVGPVWSGGGSGEEAVLEGAYRSAVRVADGLGLRTIAFPSISTGIYGYPIDLAAPIAVRAVRKALAAADHVDDAVFVLFDAITYEAYRDALEGAMQDTSAGEAGT